MRPARPQETPIAHEPQAVERLVKGLVMVEDRKGLEHVYDKLHGPLDGAAGAPEKRMAVAQDYMRAELYGMTHLKWEEYIEKHAGRDGWATNFIVPTWRAERKDDRGRIQAAYLQDQVFLSNPEDCKRIAAKHVMKQGHFTPGFFSSVISVTDVDDWKKQRDELAPAFLPATALKKRFPISRERAAACVDKLLDESAHATQPVDMNEFLLYETFAQLRLAMFGDSNEEMLALNEAHRDAMLGVRPDSQEVLKKNYATMAKNVLAEAEQRGPLCPRLLTSANDDQKTLLGNMAIFSFAGHDTTGHTLTWLLYELSRNQGIQRELQAEVDGLWARLREEQREMAYEDLKQLPFMTRCIMETLRLWPAVANGTFRVLQEDDWVTGRDGQRVVLPKGTYVQVLNWTRHRNPRLWGDDVEEFNPHRAFSDKEVWNHEGFANKNPETLRFSPFTHPPRDCIGKNFSQMEMRTILFHLLHRFSFCLPARASPMPGGYTAAKGVNYGTLGPVNTECPYLAKRDYRIVGMAHGRLPTGLKLQPTLRKHAHKL